MDSRTATIVIPTYKQPEYVCEAIESALNQTVKCDVIVVIDGSPDNTYDLIKHYPITIITQQNKGLSGARNAGIRQATTEWVLPLDSDDKIAPNMIERCLTVDADIIGVGQETFGDYVSKHNFLEAPTYEAFLLGNQINCCSLFKKSMWEDVNGYDENMKSGYEDWDFWVRATRAGYKVKTLPEFLFYYRKHGASMVTEATSKHQELHTYILNKHKK